MDTANFTMAGWAADDFLVVVNDVGSEAVANQYVGTIVNAKTKEVIHTVYGDYLMRVVGLLRIWLYQFLNGGTSPQPRRIQQVRS